MKRARSSIVKRTVDMRHVDTAKLREKRRDNQSRQAARMKKSFPETIDVRVGDLVSVPIPPANRGPLDNSFLVCIVVEVVREGLIRVCSAR